MITHAVPTSDQQLEFLKKIQRLFDEGDFTATYKYALINSLTELAVEKGDESGAPLILKMPEIAEKFAELYWPQTRPYISRQPDTQQETLVQNLGKQAAVVNYLIASREGGANTIIEARRQLDWGNQIKKIAAVVRKMPVKHLQNMGGVPEFFLFDIPAARAPLLLKPGVVYNLRRFQGFIQQLVRASWINHVRGNRQNLVIIGDSDDLETFMFHATRRRLKEVSEFLKDFDGATCFYCNKQIHDGGEVDHFVPWSHYSRDTGHNFVLAHKSCNGKKRDTLAASSHLEHWVERNTNTGNDFRENMESLGFPVDWSVTLTIAHWAYRQGVDVDSRAWVFGNTYESVDESYIDLLS